MHCPNIIHTALLGCSLSVFLASASFAQQVIPDGSLNTQVTSSANHFTIINGTAVGNNLFHSFQQFSIPTNGSATFNLINTPNISTIFSRVTGGSASSIDGVIQASQPVNLFLLNPNGILLGANARLNISGSFVGSTATGVRFSDGTVFSTTDPAPLLTMSVPIGLQMGAASREIQVQGTGNDGLVPTANLGLIGSPGATLALLGNGVTFTGGVVTAPAGRLEIGSVAAGEVRLNPTPIGTWQLDYSTIQNFADVNLAARSSLWNPYPVGNPFGGLQVVGRNVRLDRSQIAATTAGADPGGDIRIRAQETLTLEGVSPGAPFPSSQILNQVAPGATGTGGGIQIQAGRVVAREGGSIETFTFSSGDVGAIVVNADSILLSEPVPYVSPILGDGIAFSGISSNTLGSGNGSDLIINAREIEMNRGGRIFTIVQPPATGNGGSISVKSDRITASGVEFVASSGIQALTTGFGRGGDVRVETGTLALSEGAVNITFAYRLPGLTNTGFGNAGDLQVTARDRIEVVGSSPRSNEQFSTLGSITTSSGNGGNATISTPFLSIRDGGSVTTGTAARVSIFGDPSQSNRLGNGGNLTVTVAELELSGVNPLINNGSSLGTFTFGNGDAGSATINADRIRILKGANILASTLATGNSGELRINARDITIAGSQGGRDAAILASADQFTPETRAVFGLPEFPTGRTARLTIAADQITLSDRGKISTTHQGFGDASELEIRANRLSLNNQAGITATTRTGNGGNANLQVRDLLVLRNGSRISAESQGSGNGGNITLNANLIVGVNDSDIIANAVIGNGGNISLTTQGLLGITPRSQLTPDSDITASSRFGLSGTIQVNTIGVDPNSGLVELPENLTDSSQQVAQGCLPNQGSSFVMTGRGGMPANPLEQVRSDRPWSDLRDLSAHLGSTAKLSTPKALQEAIAWRRNPQTHQVELIAPEFAQISQTAVTCSPS